MLIRGRQVDGMNKVRFNEGWPVPPPAIRLPAGAYAFGSYTRVRTRGCYAYQIDGTVFSSLVVFEAAPVPPN